MTKREGCYYSSQKNNLGLIIFGISYFPTSSQSTLPVGGLLFNFSTQQFEPYTQNTLNMTCKDEKWIPILQMVSLYVVGFRQPGILQYDQYGNMGDKI